MINIQIRGNLIEVVLEKLFSKDVKINFCYPFGTFEGLENLFTKTLLPLKQSLPDLERRDMIFMAGTSLEGHDWLGCMGNYIVLYEQHNTFRKSKITLLY